MSPILLKVITLQYDCSGKALHSVIILFLLSYYLLITISNTVDYNFKIYHKCDHSLPLIFPGPEQ